LTFAFSAIISSSEDFSSRSQHLNLIQRKTDRDSLLSREGPDSEFSLEQMVDSLFPSFRSLGTFVPTLKLLSHNRFSKHGTKGNGNSLGEVPTMTDSTGIPLPKIQQWLTLGQSFQVDITIEFPRNMTGTFPTASHDVPKCRPTGGGWYSMNLLNACHAKREINSANSHQVLHKIDL
jgi:hypothetical protein